MTERPHLIDDRACWCAPWVEQPCRHCQGESWSARCVVCAGSGWEAAYDEEAPTVAIHRAQEDGP
jgi:hypothetical protein